MPLGFAQKKCLIEKSRNAVAWIKKKQLLEKYDGFAEYKHLHSNGEPSPLGP